MSKKAETFDMWWWHWRHWTAEDRAIAARFPDSLRSATNGDVRDAEIMRREVLAVKLNGGMPKFGPILEQLRRNER